MPALTAFLCPTVNAYRRMEVESLAPTHINWAVDNRLAMLRYPAQRGKATRVELRVGDGAAAIHSAVAAMLFAGLDGIDRQLELPAPCEKRRTRTRRAGRAAAVVADRRRSTRWRPTST